MKRTWMDIIESAGDASIGAALVRLARQATAVHLHESARRTSGRGAVGGTGRAGSRLAPARPFTEEGGR